MQDNTAKEGYLALCYHYIRSKKSAKEFPRILGNSEDEFRRHLDMLRKKYAIISPDEAHNFSCEKRSFGSGRYGMLITFDDGLSDHHLAARILSESGIRAVFFIPTCILSDDAPANPIIIHYTLAAFGVEDFLKTYDDALEEYQMDRQGYGIHYRKGADDPWSVIKDIKEVFKYKLGYEASRRVAVFIYKKLFLKKYPEAMRIMHLGHEEIRDMIGMGHSIGVHTHTHISVAASNLSEAEFKREIINPKGYLEKTFGVKVNALSYPFGDEKDCFDASGLVSRTGAYKMAFTVEKIVNTKVVSPFELGRYMPLGTDTAPRLEKVLEGIASQKEPVCG